MKPRLPKQPSFKHFKKLQSDFIKDGLCYGDYCELLRYSSECVYDMFRDEITYKGQTI